MGPIHELRLLVHSAFHVASCDARSIYRPCQHPSYFVPIKRSEDVVNQGPKSGVLPIPGVEVGRTPFPPVLDGPNRVP
ncbi:hypothetical protein THTE_1812 [Thermogutta terrifontis]|uniref:Uncharacterized protein n=1 Tax=Thermogutta terrifontis TaxID=1331910 RepID=A0A286REN2_9BACT|nr:hypothetical protein THTE_1812 [Thermogutta terrifontis]